MIIKCKLNFTKNKDFSKFLEKKFSLVGNSPLFLKQVEVLMGVAPTNLNVLITGETGTGKEVFANACQGLSERSKKPYVRVNCGAIPETLLESELFGHEKGAFTDAKQRRIGFFETADKGTIFLDEIGELTLGTQVKLLRILESGEFNSLGSSNTKRVDIRVIAATNKDLEEEVYLGRFRRDLFFRLKNVHIELPRLSDHPSDVALLTEYFLKTLSKKLQIPLNKPSSDSVNILSAQPWTGNTRELKNLIETMVTLEKTTELTPEILRNYLKPALPSHSQNFANAPTPIIQVPNQENLGQVELGLIFRTLMELRNDVGELKHMTHNNGLDLADLKNQIENHDDHKFEVLEDEEEFDLRLIEDLTFEEVEKIMIERLLDKYFGNRRRIAASLGISERTLYRKIRDYDLD
jgi:DNA-binding NtrC family response regulator